MEIILHPQTVSEERQNRKKTKQELNPCSQ